MTRNSLLPLLIAFSGCYIAAGVRVFEQNTVRIKSGSPDCVSQECTPTTDPVPTCTVDGTCILQIFLLIFILAIRNIFWIGVIRSLFARLLSLKSINWSYSVAQGCAKRYYNGLWCHYSYFITCGQFHYDMMIGIWMSSFPLLSLQLINLMFSEWLHLITSALEKVCYLDYRLMLMRINKSSYIIVMSISNLIYQVAVVALQHVFLTFHHWHTWPFL